MMIVSIALISLGVFFMVVSAIGISRLQGLYTRAHAVAKSETLGLLLVLSGLMFQPDIDLASVTRLLLIVFFSMLANPTAVHALLRAARRAGVRPWIPSPPPSDDPTTGPRIPETDRRPSP